jgi:2-keto-4-pentenoate hydratase/2-oxohepta-3-ene-1,7-dioic acid hydratase in catechol pathway
MGEASSSEGAHVTTLRRLGPAGAEIPAIEAEDRIFDLRPLTDDIDGAFLADGGIERAREAVQEHYLPTLDGAHDLRVGAPIARPAAIICIGQNYAAHAAESGSPPPEMPIVFFKHPSSMIGPNDPIALPRRSSKVDWEVELGVVIGSRSTYLESDEAAMAAIAGYVTSHDVSERDWQINHSSGQWALGKSAPTFAPVGPWLVPADEVDPNALRLWSTVNGAPRQDSNTSDLIFPVATVVRHLSQYMTLEPGDLINTGTPQGVALSGKYPFLAVGDVVEMGVEGLGQQRSEVVAG